jgi:PhnB protein
MSVTKRALIAALAVACAGTQAPETEQPAPEVAPEPAAPTVDPVPEGFHNVTPSLVVTDLPGAVEFYQKAIGAEHVYTHDGPDGKPMHAEIKVGDSIVMLSAENPDQNQKAPTTLKGSNGSLHVYVEDVDAVHKAAIEAGAKEWMPVADMWWGDRFSEVLDPFGHRWSLGTHQEDVPPEAMKERADAATAAMAAGKEYTWEKGAAAASYKPDSYFTVTPSLVVKGGQEAVDFYTKALGAEVVTSMVTPDGNLMHAEVKIGDSMVMLSGQMPAEGPMKEHAEYAKAPADLGGAPVQLMVYVPDTDAALATAVGAGAAKVSDPQDMFWGDRYALVTDPSGTPWGIATHIEDVPPDQMKDRMMKQLGGAAPAEGAEGAEAAEGAEGAEGEDAAEEPEGADAEEAATEGEGGGEH